MEVVAAKQMKNWEWRRRKLNLELGVKYPRTLWEAGCGQSYTDEVEPYKYLTTFQHQQLTFYII